MAQDRVEKTRNDEEWQQWLAEVRQETPDIETAQRRWNTFPSILTELKHLLGHHAIGVVACADDPVCLAAYGHVAEAERWDDARPHWLLGGTFEEAVVAEESGRLRLAID